ncbi:MAG: hypothetical protein AB7L17_00590 [Ilumatobacteraceae bacterium]
MPWCEECAKYWTPSAMNEDGTCPACGRVVEKPEPQPLVTARTLNLKKLAAGADGDETDVKAPWHFKLLMVALVLYLTWRVVDLFV